MENDIINYPAHYTDGKIECTDFIVDKALNYSRGNVVKYVVRAGKKDPSKEVEDLKKAAWYLNHEIEHLTPGTPEEKREAKIDALAALLRDAMRDITEEDFDAGIRLTAERLLDKGVTPQRR